MRCKNCGWDNPPEKQVCEKCNSPLSASGRADEGNERNERATSREIAADNPSEERKTSREGRTCPKCGYPLMAGTNFCPQCGTSLDNESDKVDSNRHTVMPGHRSHCTLTMLPDDKEVLKGTVSHSFSGEEILLNRENTEPENNTITSKTQAALTYFNKKWFIQDRSELQTTYLRPAEKTEIKDGDIIVLGDRRFRFNT